MSNPSAIQIADFFVQFQLEMIKKGRMNIASFAAKQCDKYIKKHIAELIGVEAYSKAYHPTNKKISSLNILPYGFQNE